MSVRVLSAVLGNFHEDSDPAERLVLIALADEAHDDGITWVSQETIAEAVQLSDRHVRRCVKALEERGEIDVRKVRRGRSQINVYRVTAAPSEPNLGRLPSEIAVAFSPGHPVRLSNGRPKTFTRTSTPDSPGHPRPISQPMLSIGPVRGPVEASPPPLASLAALSDDPQKPPKLTKIEGRDIAFDALAEECGVDPAGNRAREVAVALNGARSQVGIRTLAWREMIASSLPAEQGEHFERWLVSAIQAKAARYREAMRGAFLTPTALAKWWTDVERAAPLDQATAAFVEARRLAEAGL